MMLGSDGAIAMSPIDGEPCAELADSARDVEHADQRPEGRKTDVEFRAQQWKQRRQDELEKVRQAMRRADQADYPGVIAERAGGCGIQRKCGGA